MPNVRLEKPRNDRAHIFFANGRWVLWTGQSTFQHFNAIWQITNWIDEHRRLTK